MIAVWRERPLMRDLRDAGYEGTARALAIRRDGRLAWPALAPWGNAMDRREGRGLRSPSRRSATLDAARADRRCRGTTPRTEPHISDPRPHAQPSLTSEGRRRSGRGAGA